MNQCTKRFWVLLPGYISRDFADFKKSILAKYPGAEKGIHYTCRDLERLVANSADSGLSTETELMEYYYDFLPIATWFVDNKKISETLRDQYFWEGLPASVQTTIDRRLELKLPDYSRDEPPAFEKVLEAGRFVFADNVFNADNPLTTRLKAIHNEERSATNTWDKRCSSQTRDDSDDSEDEKDARQEVRTKTVRFNAQPPNPKSAMDEVEELARKMHGLDIRDVAYSGCYTRLVCLAPAAANTWPSPRACQQGPPHASGNRPYAPQGDFSCFFCGLAHLLRNCPHLSVLWYCITC